MGCVGTQNEKVKQLNDDGLFQFSRGEFRAASESFEMAVELQPADPSLLYNLGQSYDRMGDVKKAEVYYVQSLLQDNDQHNARYALGQLYYRQGRQADFQRLLDEWYQLQPREPFAYVMDGWRLRQEKAYPDSQAKFQQALALEPHHPRALTELGMWFEKMELPEYARTMYERSLARQPDQPEVQGKLEQLKARNIGPPLPLQ